MRQIQHLTHSKRNYLESAYDLLYLEHEFAFYECLSLHTNTFCAKKIRELIIKYKKTYHLEIYPILT